MISTRLPIRLRTVAHAAQCPLCCHPHPHWSLNHIALLVTTPTLSTFDKIEETTWPWSNTSPTFFVLSFSSLINLLNGLKMGRPASPTSWNAMLSLVPIIAPSVRMRSMATGISKELQEETPSITTWGLYLCNRSKERTVWSTQTWD